MLKGQDIVVLLKTIGSEPLPVRSLAAEIGFDPAGTHRALRRLADVGLYSPERGRAVLANVEEYLIHGIKYMFPAKRGRLVRGMPTSWAAEPLSSALAPPSEPPPVWPFPKGSLRGVALEPLHRIVPNAAQADPVLWRRLALTDALRSNEGPRLSNLAADLLRKDLQR